MDVLAQHAWSKGTETFSEFDLDIEIALQSGISRVTNDTPGTQCTRAKLGSPVKPADDLSLGHARRNMIKKARLLIKSTVPGSDLVQKLPHFQT
jgi:hypothetical protein